MTYISDNQRKHTTDNYPCCQVEKHSIRNVVPLAKLHHFTITHFIITHSFSYKATTPSAIFILLNGIQQLNIYIYYIILEMID